MPGTLPGSVAAVRRALLLLTTAAICLSGCNANTSQETPEAKVVRPGELVAVEGPAPVGRFFVKAGADSLASDLYRMFFSPPAYERLTTDERVTTVGGCADKIVVAAAQKKVGYVDTLQELRDGKLGPVESVGLINGSGPDLSPDCRLLYLQTKEQGGGLIQEIHLFDPATGNDSVVTSGATVYGASWGPGGEMLVLRREPTGPKLDVIRPAGDRAELDPQVPDVGNTQWGKAGWIAIDVFTQPQQPPTATLFLNPATGARSTLDGWLPLAWSPDGGQLLVRDAAKGTTLAVVDASDLTKTRNVGVSEVGPVWDAVWLPEER